MVLVVLFLTAAGVIYARKLATEVNVNNVAEIPAPLIARDDRAHLVEQRFRRHAVPRRETGLEPEHQ